MTTPAEQYRALVTRLESIVNEADTFPTLRIGDIDPKNGKKILDALVDGSGNVVRSRFGEIWNVKYGEPDKAPEPVAEPEKAPEKAPENPAEPAKEPEKAPEPNNVAPVEPAKPEPSEPMQPQIKCGPEVKEKIRQQKSFNAAYKMAREAGCPDFDWCQIVAVPGQAPTPAPKTQGKVDYLGQQDPLGGDKENPMSFAPNSNFGAEEGFESDGYILEDELNRVREIAGTQVVAEAGEIPEIKASTKEKAIEIARKKGIAKFRFCGKYKVQQAKKPKQAPTPAPRPVSPPIPNKGEKLQGVTTNPMGDFDPTAFSGDFTGGTKR